MQIKNAQHQKLGTQQKQGYYMSQQHLKLMHLMHLTGFALREYITNEIEINPALEIENEIELNNDNLEDNEEEVDLSNELFWKQDDDLFDKSLKDQKVSREYFDAPVINYNTLQENLKNQISLMEMHEELKEITFFLIDELDNDGYLRRSTDDVADDYSFQHNKYVTEDKIKQALYFLQECEPAGIGARSLQECLLLQLRRKEHHPNKVLAIKIVEKYFNELTSGDLRKLLSVLNLERNQIEESYNLILKLSPKPFDESNKYEQLKHHIVPDFEVTTDGNDLYVSLINYDTIRVKVNEDYLKNSPKGNYTTEKKPTETYVQNLISEAQMLVNALRDRETTMINVMHSIVKMQPEFFRSGDIKQLKPMILQDIADRTKFDISAVSRITSNKHVQTPFGIFSLKQLFMRAVSGENIGTRASTSVQVQEFIQKIVDDEDKSKPLSDTEIMDVLKKNKINVARRTIVKYRELSGIPNSASRKRVQFPLN